MALRIFLAPIATDLTPHPVTGKILPSRYMAYRDELAGTGFSGIDFGFEPVFLLVADVGATQLAALVAHADVTVMPANLDNTLGAARQAVEDALEARNLTGNWVTSGMTYRDVARVVAAVCGFAGLFGKVTDGGRLFPPGIDLTTTYGSLSQNVRDKIRQSLDVLGYDRSTLNASSTIRDLLRLIGEQAGPWSCGVAPGVSVTV